MESLRSLQDRLRLLSLSHNVSGDTVYGYFHEACTSGLEYKDISLDTDTVTVYILSYEVRGGMRRHETDLQEGGELGMTWKKQLYDEIAKAHDVGDDFELEELYALEQKFKGWYPQNQHVLETMRDVIQDLRDEGKIKFIDYDGKYQRIA